MTLKAIIVPLPIPYTTPVHGTRPKSSEVALRREHLAEQRSASSGFTQTGRIKVEDVLFLLRDDRAQTPQGWELGEVGTKLANALLFFPGERLRIRYVSEK